MVEKPAWGFGWLAGGDHRQLWLLAKRRKNNGDTLIAVITGLRIKFGKTIGA